MKTYEVNQNIQNRIRSTASSIPEGFLIHHAAERRIKIIQDCYDMISYHLEQGGAKVQSIPFISQM
jgi:hypothetical protein